LTPPAGAPVGPSPIPGRGNAGRHGPRRPRSQRPCRRPRASLDCRDRGGCTVRQLRGGGRADGSVSSPLHSIDRVSLGAAAWSGETSRTASPSAARAPRAARAGRAPGTASGAPSRRRHINITIAQLRAFVATVGEDAELSPGRVETETRRSETAAARTRTVGEWI
jgi:hypothetical protein